MDRSEAERSQKGPPGYSPAPPKKSMQSFRYFVISLREMAGYIEDDLSKIKDQ